MRAFLFAFLIAACGGTTRTSRPVEPVGSGSASAPMARAESAVVAKPVTEATVSLAGGANALYWDAAGQALYLTDSGADSLLSWTDRGGVQTVAKLPAGTAGISLGGIVKRTDGTRLVTSFGFGKQGTLFAIGADGTATALSGLDPARRRVGLAQDASGVLYTVYFAGGKGNAVGGVATLRIDGTTANEFEIAGPASGVSLGKLVGVVATPNAVFVSDQSQKIIYKLTTPGFAIAELAHVPDADLLIMLPNGDLLTGGGASITRITQAGQVSALAATGFEQVRGLAYDPAGKRLFVIDHSQTVGTPDKLRIIPLAN